ncbi:MAG: hypothetical protein AB7J28_14675 [Hyphomonadaceae bacterium]
MAGAPARHAENWARRFDVRARGRADGAADAPAPEEAGPSAYEREIADAMARERASLEGERSAVRDEAERAFRRLSPAAPDIEGPLAEARLTLAQIEGRAAPECAAAREEAERARADFEGFRRAAGLRRGAVYPESTLFQAGLLLCAAVFEALFSATLFAQEAEQGLLGGAVVAIGLSAANVTLGFLAGFLGLRYLQPARALSRVLGAIAFGAMLLLAAGLNLFAARWRESLSALSEPQRIDPFAPRLDLFGFAEPQAVVLLMLGAGVWVFAALKGYSGFDDPYPDYGKMHRAHRDAERALAGLREEVREALEGAVDDAREEIGTRISAMRERVGEMRTTYDEAAADIGIIDAKARRLADEAASLIHLYRQENAAARAAPAPAYFADPPATHAQTEDALVTLGRMLDEAQSALAAAQTRASAALDDLARQMEAISARLYGRSNA